MFHRPLSTCSLDGVMGSYLQAYLQLGFCGYYQPSRQFSMVFFLFHRINIASDFCNGVISVIFTLLLLLSLV